MVHCTLGLPGTGSVQIPNAFLRESSRSMFESLNVASCLVPILVAYSPLEVKNLNDPAYV